MFVKTALLGLFLAFAGSLPEVEFPAPPYPINANEIPPAYWENLARKHIDKANQLFPDLFNAQKKVKNVILFLGDGMGVPTLSASRFFDGYKSGEAVKQSFEDWDFGTMCRTYDLETMVTDSASSATAYLTGTKTRTSMIGVTGAVEVKQCSVYTDEQKTESALIAAMKAGKWAGIVTSARVTHASPAGVFGHVAFRDWECDAEIHPLTGKGECTDLAVQLAKDNQDIHVVLGGGQQKFYPKTTQLPSMQTENGERLDNRNLADEWLSDQKSKSRNAAYAGTPAEFKSLNFEKLDYVMGLLSPSHLPYELDRKPEDPGLFDLTMAALKVLKRSPNGFVLFVEGARIDQAHHENRAHKSLVEMQVFNQIIGNVSEMFKDDGDILMLVTADHSHSFELMGQPSRFINPLLRDTVKGPLAEDRKGMLPVGYMTGPGAKMNESRANLNEMSDAELLDKEFQQQALIPIGWATHGGDDVAVYAKGPFSYLFHRTVDNTFVAQAMKYALGVPPYNHEPYGSAPPYLKVSLSILLAVMGYLLSN